MELRFGRYLLTRRLAIGGMAEIYQAKLVGAEGFEKQLVIKKILPQWSSDPGFVSMLVDEAKIVVQLSHPNIVQVYELGKEKDSYFIAMEYVAGMDLREVLRRSGKKPVPLDIALAVLVESLAGLSFAHHQQVIHRDISPQNILLSFNGEIKITDFGIAKAASRSQETASGVLKGKFAYMSPEQATGVGLDQRSDLFSCGIVLYELLTGERLFGGKGDLDTLDQVRRSQVNFSAAAGQRIPAGLKTILLKALAKNASDRYGTAEELRNALLHFAAETSVSLRTRKVADFVKELSREEVAEKVFSETMEIRPTATRSVWGLLLMVGLIGGFIYFKFHHRMTSPSPAAAVAGESGMLSVQAIPWGSVFVDAAARGEAPLRETPFEAGSHEVRVFHEPTGKSLATTVTLLPHHSMICVANFPENRMQCKNI